MKVLFLINSLKNKSGSERVACNLGNLFLNDLNFEVRILNRDASKNESAYKLDDAIIVEKISGTYLNFFFETQAYLELYKPDFLIVHNMGKLSLFASFLQLRGVRLISLEHVAFISRPRWIQFLSKLFYRKIDSVVVLTKNDIDSYQKISKKIFKINNISPFEIDLNQNYNSESKEIIAIGRLTYQKNFEALLRSWSLIEDKIQDWSLKIYGCGEEYQTLQNLIHHKNIKNAKLMGESNDIQQIYRMASFYVMSSRYEGLPMVLIEAQTFGLPIISFDCPHGPSEVIQQNVNGLLVENENIENLAASIFELIMKPVDRKEFSNKAKENSKQYSKEYVLAQWKQLFGE